MTSKSGKKLMVPEIRFVPIFEDEKFVKAVEEYERIWQENKKDVVGTFKENTGLDFVESRIAAVAYDGVSYSGRNPQDMMRLRYSYSPPAKRGMLVHELGHRLMFNLDDEPVDLSSHQLLNLFLYDCWVDLYGKEFADKMVEMEKSLAERYKKCWDWALELSREERGEKLRSLVRNLGM